MDCALLEQHLAQAEKHRAVGKDVIARQRQIVAELAHRGGQDLTLAQT